MISNQANAAQDKDSFFEMDAETQTQAARVIELFGGPYKLASALKELGKAKVASSIYRWTYPREKGGCGGLIPTKAWPDILAVARLYGILLTAEIMDPREKAKQKIRYEK